MRQLPQLQRGELHLRRPTPTEHVHIRDRGGGQVPVHVVRDLGGQQVLGMLGQDPGHIQGHVPVADHRHLRGLQRPVPRHIRVPVVPGREIRATERAGQLHPRHVQGSVPHRTGGEHDRVVMPTQIRQAQVRAVVHIPQETDVPAVHDLVQRGDDALDARMVRGHPVADEAERGRVPVEQVDADTEVPFLLGQDVRRVHPGGSGTDDGDAQRAVRPRGRGGQGHARAPSEVGFRVKIGAGMPAAGAPVA